MTQRKPKLLVILGAGSSMPFGFPSVQEVGQLMKKWSEEWTASQPNPDHADVFNRLWDMSDEYYGQNSYGLRTNYERVLGEMTTLANGLISNPFGSPLFDALTRNPTHAPIELNDDETDEFASFKVILRQREHLLEKLATHMRGLCKTGSSTAGGDKRFTDFLAALRENYDVGIYNLNYDTVARTSWPRAFNGFGPDGHFDPFRVVKRENWGFIYQPHGSVHHCISRPRTRQRIVWKDDLEGTFSDRAYSSTDLSYDLGSMPLTTLISGGYKLNQLLKDPYLTFHSTLTQHARVADAVLIAGYGFGDLHVNQALRNRFTLPDDYMNPHPKVCIIEMSCPTRYTTNRLEPFDMWSRQVKDSTQTSFRRGNAPSLKQDRGTLASIMKAKEFEFGQEDRVAIWHNGLCEAFDAVDKIIDFLTSD